MIHGRSVDAAGKRVLAAGPLSSTAGWPVLAGSMPLLSGLLRLLWCCPVRNGSTAAAPPSTSLPSGVSGRRIRSLIHASLFMFDPQVAGSHIYEPLLLPTQLRSGQSLAWPRFNAFAEIDSVRPSGARKIRREERRHGKCGDWRTLLS